MIGAQESTCALAALNEGPGESRICGAPGSTPPLGVVRPAPPGCRVGFAPTRAHPGKPLGTRSHGCFAPSRTENSEASSPKAVGLQGSRMTALSSVKWGGRTQPVRTPDSTVEFQRRPIMSRARSSSTPSRSPWSLLATALGMSLLLSMAMGSTVLANEKPPFLAEVVSSAPDQVTGGCPTSYPGPEGGPAPTGRDLGQRRRPSR